MTLAIGHAIKRANRDGFYRICYALPCGSQRFVGSWTERVVDRQAAVKFAARHGIKMPN